MTKFLVLMLDECGSEFSRTVTAVSRDAARAKARDDYPESRVISCESPADSRRREADVYRRANRAYEEGW